MAKRFKNRGIRIIGIVALVLFGTLLFSFGIFGKTIVWDKSFYIGVGEINHKTYTKQELAEDLKQLEKNIMQKNPLYFTDKAKLQALFSKAYEQLEDGLTEEEYYRLLNPLVAAVNCGHTNLSISEALLANREQTAKFFPLKVTLLGNQLYVLEDEPDKGIKAGDRIQSINGKSSEEIITLLMQNISGDGSYETKRRYIISNHFNSRFYDFVDNSENFRVALVDEDGLLKTADLKAKFRPEFNTTAWDLHFLNSQNGDYYQGKIYDDYALLTIRIFRNEKDNKFEHFLREFFTELRTRNITKLVIDLRGNYGGDSFMAKNLLAYLTSEEFPYFAGDYPLIYRLLGFLKPVVPQEPKFNGKVAVLTDGAVFSTAAHLCALIRYHDLGTLVGSEAGGTYVCTDGARDTVLKHTRLRLHNSTQVFQVQVERLSPNSGVKPDISVAPTIEEILAHRDPVMEAGLKALSQ
ncbi:MAG: S41 family peptidase [Desulfitobacteriia bacterium]|jgi:C-terminal processing protease CtpA/Prc